MTFAAERILTLHAKSAASALFETKGDNFMIHQFTIQGTHLVLDVNSGAVHVLDNQANRVLACYDEDGRLNVEKLSMLERELGIDIVAEARAELESLIDEGLLFSADPYQKLFTSRTTPPVVKALCLHIAHDCNMRCKYCFAGEGNYHGDKAQMPIEIGQKAIDFVIGSSGNRKNIEIDFFGGEPLLNLETVKGIVNYAKTRGEASGKRFRFTITTNGTLLDDDAMAYLNETMDNIVLSLDGRRIVHDGMRVRKDGSGTYDAILPKLQKMASIRNGRDYYIRGTYTAKNLDFSADVLHMAELGFDQISIEPVVLPDGSGFEIRKEHLPILFQEYEKLAAELLKLRKQGRAVNFFHFMIDLEGGPCVAKRLRGCGSGTEYLAVTPQGDLYPCHQFTGIREFRMGDVFTGINRPEIVSDFQKVNVYTKPQCRECWARFYCSGGCAANAWNFGKDLAGVYEIGCELQKKRVECALWMKANEKPDES